MINTFKYSNKIRKDYEMLIRYHEKYKIKHQDTKKFI